MNGCLKGLFRLFVFALLLVGVAAAYWYRRPLAQAFGRLVGRRDTALPKVSPDSGVGAPTPSALASAQRKLASLGQSRGPDSVVLTPNEMASLVGSGIDWSVRRSFDSLRIELQEGSIAVNARLDTRLIPQDALGPLRGLLGEREPIRIAGPLRVARPGVARWTVQSIALRGFPFPAPAVRALARQTAGADTSGSVALQVDPAVADLALHPGAVVLYRRRRP